MRFHLIDRIDAYEPERFVRARKLTSWSEDHWDGAGPEAVMPPALVLEAFLQAGTWLIVLSTSGRKRAALASIGSVAFVDDVRPGDVLELEGDVETMSEEAAVLSGRVTVDGREVLRARDVMCVLLDVGELQAEEETRRMVELLTRVEA